MFSSFPYNASIICGANNLFSFLIFKFALFPIFLDQFTLDFINFVGIFKEANFWVYWFFSFINFIDFCYLLFPSLWLTLLFFFFQGTILGH